MGWFTSSSKELLNGKSKTKSKALVLVRWLEMPSDCEIPQVVDASSLQIVAAEMEREWSTFTKRSR